MNPRIFALAFGAMLFALCSSAAAQQIVRPPTIGWLDQSSPNPEVLRLVELFRKGLHDLGYMEGKNLAIEYRYAHGKTERLEGLAAELVRLKVDCIVTAGGQPTGAAQRATKTVPIVMAVSGDPVASGFVTSFARPGGNITGLATIPGPEIYGKQVELLKEAIPKLNRIGVLSNPTNPFSALALKETETTSRRFGMSLQLAEARSADEIETALAALTKGHVGALLELQDPMFFGQRTRLADLEAKNGCRRCTQAQNMWRLVA